MQELRLEGNRAVQAPAQTSSVSSTFKKLGAIGLVFAAAYFIPSVRPYVFSAALGAAGFAYYMRPTPPPAHGQPLEGRQVAALPAQVAQVAPAARVAPVAPARPVAHTLQLTFRVIEDDRAQAGADRHDTVLKRPYFIYGRERGIDNSMDLTRQKEAAKEAGLEIVELTPAYKRQFNLPATYEGFAVLVLKHDAHDREGFAGAANQGNDVGEVYDKLQRVLGRPTLDSHAYREFANLLTWKYGREQATWDRHNGTEPLEAEYPQYGGSEKIAEIFRNASDPNQRTQVEMDQDDALQLAKDERADANKDEIANLRLGLTMQGILPADRLIMERRLQALGGAPQEEKKMEAPPRRNNQAEIVALQDQIEALNMQIEYGGGDPTAYVARRDAKQQELNRLLG